MERDLGTKLDWIGVDHRNTDNPHLHILVRGKADDGRDGDQPGLHQPRHSRSSAGSRNR
jgi:type IV secretory pathway VirD2 relaxase